MSDFDKLVDAAQEDVYHEIKTTTRSVAQKMRALRDEFGYQKTEPKPQEEDDNEDSN